MKLSWLFGGSVASRRAVLLGGLAFVAAAAHSAHALEDPGFQGAPVEWQDRFDSDARATQLPHTSVPLLSAQTIQATEQALQQYAAIEAQGGWPAVQITQRIGLGARAPEVVALRQRLMASGDLASNAGISDTFDSYVEGAVRRFQARHGIIPSGAIDETTRDALNVPVSVRRRQLEMNISRLRSMGNNLGERFVMVNIPGAEIEAVESGVVASRHTAVVGKADRPSPVMSARIQDINFNPFWTVPPSLIRKDLIPKMQAEPDYLTKNKIRIYDQRGNELQPSQVNWNSDEATNYMFRQDPGEVNSLGSVRINLPNKDSVYMHDTPSKGLFGENARFHSSGCVRVQNVRELVSWLLQKNGGWNRHQIDAVIRSGDRTDVKLVQAVPAYWVYVTAWGTADGIVQFREDIYNRDGIGELAAR